ncbi:immunoglobulin domain-containing protein [Streptomyces sp. NBC_00038]|uniref:immunoglobulin domain-containing protein n=1 Tax=Streptomyces sp. NBC_00038 TaxID=2903615 RepID=UPI00225082AC|nr:immunoglobulin domain-containing protein [Streptomyces sp. NBC_00038]MCX5561733.1 immunoglobulin domain-containing protein [Streptomyces sp. NBC_00038]
MTDDSPDRQRRDDRTRPRFRRSAALLGAVALVAAGAVAVTVGSTAQAADTPKTALGKDGQKLTVSASANLDPAGEELTVTGSGYDDTKGIYVAVCKDNGDNRVPTPCLGGADQTGGSGSSIWIIPRDASDEGAGGVAIRWGEGGTFDVELGVKAKDSGLDCLQVACSVVTRVDHNGSGDRSQDVRIPITFEGQDPGDGDDGDGVDVPAGTVSYVQSAEFTTAGRPLDLLLHPDSGKLYVGSDNIPDTADVAEQGLYVLDPKDGKVLSHIAQAPGLNGAMANRVVRRIVASLAGDGVVFHYPLRGIGTAKDGDTVAQGIWATGATFTGVGQDADTSTVLVAAGPELRRVEIATGTVKDTVTLEGGNELGVDAAHGAAWSVGTAEGKRVLRRVDTGTFDVTATAELTTDILTFVEPDPATGNVWVGNGTSVLVFDKDAKLLTTLTGADRSMAMAFDQTTGRAFVLREDVSDGTTDNTGTLQILDSATFQPVAADVALPGSVRVGYAGVAVTPGATSVYITRSMESKVVKFDLRMSPKVVQSPTDRSAAPGDEVTFVAAAEGTPEPTVNWQVSSDGGQTWSAIEGATRNAYTFTAKAAQDDYEYRAEFKNSVGTTRTSPITLTVTEASGDGGTTTGGDDGDEDTEPSGTKTVTGSEGQKLTVTPVNNLATEDQTLKVTGSGYDEEKGIYVALCVDNGDGELPTPCIGGVDMTGASHSSAWISSNPPDYGEELAIPYGEDGSFEVELTVDAKDEYTDCFEVTCVLATRADHTLSGDRSQDVKVPVAFVGQDPVDTDDGDTGGTDGGSTTSGGTTSTGGSSSGSTTGGTTGGSTSTGTTTTGGSLASTGVTVLSVAALAALLTAGGWFVYRRAQVRGTDTP